ncbi:YqzE family protein [Sutcliffiella cohnii]|uniref:YqzE family protein n=1 Tax=Sutcliffiella cohnii TaxID=33932 RepID=A0A223KSP9_9BACI|nr:MULTISPECIES: YqzE family protein [Sutcliffiella]AST92521.1 YqzE family protein [Sutcliffiella cohnii]MED4019041.1 YqzE family protein [Sutcliffiella cohnii]WBL13766.1 YqzE family protein [Sutcliffiella sp. NC1]
MKTNDYVKYVTQQLVSYMDQPKDVRKEQRIVRKQEQAPLSNQWLGVIPLSLKLMFKKKES